MTSHLAKLLPGGVDEGVYHEPFLGAGSLFFYLQPRRAVLSDVNDDLVNTYRCIRANCGLIARYVARHKGLDSEEHYFRVREQFNQAKYYTAAQAARFIYLNRTCFNGIYRVNKDGEFNVPFGWRDNPIFPGIRHLGVAARALKCARILSASYEKALDGAARGDFVFLDPPYPPLNGTSFFTHYTADRFSRPDQNRLAAVVRELDKANCRVMVCNADLPWIRRLYAGFNRVVLDVARYVTSHNKKHKVSELVITNYDTDVIDGGV